MKSSEFAKLLSIFQHFVEGLPDAQVRLLLDGHGQLRIASETGSEAPSAKRRATSKVDPSEVMQRLGECKIRQTGLDVLESLSKHDLLAVAKHLNIHVDKSLSKTLIGEKIVERTIGTKLRRIAIDSLVTH